MPVTATDEITADYRAVRTAAGLLDRSDRGVLEVTGRDRTSFLHAMLSNEVKSVGPGQGCSAAFLDVHGKVQVLIDVWALEDRLLVITPDGMADETLQSLDKFLFAEKVDLRDATGELAMLMLAGPDAPALAARLTGVTPGERPWANAPAKLAGADVRIVRGAGEAAEADVWIVAPTADGARIRRACLDAGVRSVSAEAWEPLRIEGGTPVYGRDVDATTLLPEIPVERWVSYTKGCYIGQEVVVRIRDRGHVNRHLRGLRFAGVEVPPANATLLAGDEEVGRVTSAAFSPGSGCAVALGYVRRQHADAGSQVAALAGDRTLAATVTALPMPR
jgi:folate-binding protein YgfZ